MTGAAAATNTRRPTITGMKPRIVDVIPVTFA
jgi:hypothetical protein